MRDDPKVTPIVLDDVVCTGTEKSISDCSLSLTHNCLHSEDVVVTCKDTSLTNYRLSNAKTFARTGMWIKGAQTGVPSQWGKVEYLENGVWNPVCITETQGGQYFTDANAKVMCRSLGLPTNIVKYTNEY